MFALHTQPAICKFVAISSQTLNLNLNLISNRFYFYIIVVSVNWIIYLSDNLINEEIRSTATAF